MAGKKSNTSTAKATSIAAIKAAEKSRKVSPLIDEGDPLQTLSNVRGVIEFLSFTAGDLVDGGSNEDSTHGLTMILDCAAHAIDHATQELQPKAVNHA